MIFYFARVQDTEGNWHRKVGKTKDPNKRFSDKRENRFWCNFIFFVVFDNVGIIH